MSDRNFKDALHFNKKITFTMANLKNVTSQKGLIKVRLQKVNDSSKKFVGAKKNGDSLLEFLDFIIGYDYPNHEKSFPKQVYICH